MLLLQALKECGHLSIANQTIQALSLVQCHGFYHQYKECPPQLLHGDHIVTIKGGHAASWLTSSLEPRLTFESEPGFEAG